MAAVLACGPGAVLSHRSAAELWRLLKPMGGRVDVTVTDGAGRRSRQRAPHPPFPFTASSEHDASRAASRSPPRPETLADLERTEPDWLYRRALRQAEYLGLDTGGEATAPAATWRARSCASAAATGSPSRSATSGSAASPSTSCGGSRAWSWRPTATRPTAGRQAFLDDRARELELGALGFRLRRFSDEQVIDAPDRVVGGRPARTRRVRAIRSRGGRRRAKTAGGKRCS